jgi:hypothetical protein
MGKVKNIQLFVEEICREIYEAKGYQAVIDHIDDMQSIGNQDYKDVKYEVCHACNNEMPSLNHICLICGQETQPQYFKIIKQGWNSNLQRQEVQIHCGENGNLFLIKTEEGFIVDVYNQDDNVNSMTVWEDDLIPDDEE